MSGIGNRITPKPPLVIIESTESSVEYMCISCFMDFTVFPGRHQTLFCRDCMDHLQKSIIREKTNNYGW